jgi:hypothetical protein
LTVGEVPKSWQELTRQGFAEFREAGIVSPEAEVRLKGIEEFLELNKPKP